MTTARTAARWATRVVVITPVLVAVVLSLAVVSGQVRTVTLLSGSMGDQMPTGAILLERPVDGDDVAVGDVLTYRPPSYDRPVTHRVVELETDGGRRYAITQGDANTVVDDWRVPLDDQQHWVARGHVGGLRQLGQRAYDARYFLGVALPLLLLGLAVRAGLDERRRDRSRHPAPTASTAGAAR